MARIIDFNGSYTFSSYFNLPFNTEDILLDFGYSFEKKKLFQPDTNNLFDSREIASRLSRSLPYIETTNEIARREFLIAPILTELVYATNCKIKPEYTIFASEQLKGTLDYFISKNELLIVIEAKKSDLDKGFTQLAVELIAVEKWLLLDDSIITGVVSNGVLWQFGQLNTNNNTIYQDTTLYVVPQNLPELLTNLSFCLT